MAMQDVVTTSKAFEGMQKRAENLLYKLNPAPFDKGWVHGVHIGRNADAPGTSRGEYRVTGSGNTMASAIYFDNPDKVLPTGLIANEDAKRSTYEARVSDSVRSAAALELRHLAAQGFDKEKAQAQVNDSISKIGYFDREAGKFISERIISQVNDSVIGGLATPYWDIAQIQKVFKPPFQKGYAQTLVSKVGVPNIWADLVQIFIESFEGSARFSAVSNSTGEANTSIGVRNKVDTLLSNVVNLVIDYESPTFNDLKVGAQPGNWLTNATMGDRDRYAVYMLDQLVNQLYYFGGGNGLFDGLAQIALLDDGPGYDTVQFWTGVGRTPMSTIWANDASVSTPQTNGVLALKQLEHLFADIIEESGFLPTSIRVCCSPVVYKGLKFLMMSDQFNPNSPLSIIGRAFEYGNKVTATMAVKGLDSAWSSFEIVSDMMLMPGTPFNDTTEDIMFITLPTWQSALEDGNLNDVLIAPTLIDSMILPSAPGYRDGMVRTAMKRIGGLLAPVKGCVYRIDGVGVQAP